MGSQILNYDSTELYELVTVKVASLTVLSYGHSCLLIYRERLFNLINDQPSVHEVVTGKRLSKDKPGADSGPKSKTGTKVSIQDVHIYFIFVIIKNVQAVYITTLLTERKTTQRKPPKKKGEL